MPYIDKRRRAALDPTIRLLAERLRPATPGDLNYVISRLMVYATLDCERPGYACLSKIRGAVQDASDEFYRRVMAPYEDAKLANEGDVFGEALKRLGTPG